jgi:hypothetical protein
MDSGQQIHIPTNVSWCSQMNSGFTVNKPSPISVLDKLFTLGYYVSGSDNLYALPRGYSRFKRG